MWIDERTYVHRENDGVCVCCFLCLNHLTGVISNNHTHTHPSGMQFILFEFYCVTMTFCYIQWRAAHTIIIIIILTISFTTLTTAREKFRPQYFIAFSRSPHLICLPARLLYKWIYIYTYISDRFVMYLILCFSGATWLFIYIQTNMRASVWMCAREYE